MFWQVLANLDAPDTAMVKSESSRKALESELHDG
jgi:hypothetical protein